MNLEDFHLLDNTPFNNSISERKFLKLWHQQGAQLNDPNQEIEFIFGENNNYHQCGNSYLEFDTSVRGPTAAFNKNAEIRMGNNGFAFCFKEASCATTGGMEIEHVKFIGQISTIMRSLTSKDGDLLSYFDNINNTDANTSINNNSLKDWLINSHSAEVSRGKVRGQLPLEHIFGFLKLFKKITKNFRFHLTFKTTDLQDIIFTTMANHINVTINSVYLYVPILIPNSDTQVMFNESIKNNCTITYDS